MEKTYKYVYWSILAGIVLLAVILELFPVLDGILPKGSMLEFCLQYALIIITLIDIYVALKMIKKNPVVRMALLEGPAIVGIVCYHLFMNASFGYLAIICVIAYAFVYPAKVDTEVPVDVEPECLDSKSPGSDAFETTTDSDDSEEESPFEHED